MVGDVLTLGMTPATRLFPSGQAASYVDRILKGEKPLPCPVRCYRKRRLLLPQLPPR